jgi:hypothetical protein
MATTIKSIKSSGGDYATMNLAEAGLSGAGAMTGPWVFVVNNEIITETTNTTWSGAYSGLSSANNITIQPDFVGSGATGSSNTDCSFAGNNDYSSVALDYNGTAGKGAGFKTNGNVVTITFKDHMVITNLQFNDTTGYNSMLKIAGGGDTSFTRNICRNAGAGGTLLESGATAGSTLVANCLLAKGETSGTGTAAADDGLNATYWVANTILVVYPASPDSSRAFHESYASSSFFYQNVSETRDATNGYPCLKGGSSPTGDYNFQNGLGAGSALPTAGNSSTAGVYASDITSGAPGSVGAAIDARPKVGSSIIGFIPSGSVYNPASGIAHNANLTDIRGQTRVGVDNDCGCFQQTVAVLYAYTLMGQIVF